MEPGHSPMTPVLVVQQDSEDLEQTRRILEGAHFTVITARNSREAVELICDRLPLCMVVENGVSPALDRSILEDLKDDSISGRLPVITLLDRGDLANGIDWLHLPADDFLTRPPDPQELVARVRMLVARAQRDLHSNPLTGLPGNPAIMAEAEQRLRSDRHFAFAHVDIDWFKAFNDRYGFGRGDDVLRMTARLLLNTVKAVVPQEGYVGHIGGDDFVFIASSGTAAAVCERLIRDFDDIAPSFYDESDRLRGAIESVDRQGNPQTYPVMSISVGVVDTSLAPASHVGELCARVAEVKSFAKRVRGSSYLIDRRHP